MKVSAPRFRSTLLLILVALPATGCVRRRLFVRTTPPGARISIDNQVIGTSPAATSYTYEGGREIRAELPGYRTETVVRKIRPRWYEVPPLDFFSETLWPFEIRDERVIDIELIPQEVLPVDTVLSRANSLRNQSQQGVVSSPNISVMPPTVIDSRPALPQMIEPNQLPPGGVPLE